MARPSRSRGRLFLVAIALGACALVWIQDRTGISIRTSFLTLVVMGVGALAWSKYRVWRRWHTMRISQVDKLPGRDFERYVSRLLEHQGYRVTITGASGDLGVDLLAVRKGRTVAVQVKRQADKVSRRAVSDAVAGRIHYKADSAMVVTNSFFSPGAKELGKSTACDLVDRTCLASWISEFQSQPGVIFRHGGK